jgi:hypothetical protein
VHRFLTRSSEGLCHEHPREPDGHRGLPDRRPGPDRGRHRHAGVGYLVREPSTFISFFQESVNGLEKGAPVKFQGVPVGNVTGS